MGLLNRLLLRYSLLIFAVSLKVLAWGQCAFSVPNDTPGTPVCPIDLVQVIGWEPDTDGLLFTQVWTSTTDSAAIEEPQMSGASSIGTIFNGSNNGAPSQFSLLTGGDVLFTSALGISYTTNSTGPSSYVYTWPTGGTSREQVVQDAWLIFPNGVTCIDFELENDTEKSAALYISDSLGTNGSMTLLMEGSGLNGNTGAMASLTINPALPTFGSPVSFRYTRIRLYHHDPDGIANSTIRWDIGNGMEPIPRAFLHSVSGHFANTNRPTGIKPSHSFLAYQDSLGNLFRRDSLQGIGDQFVLDTRYWETVEVLQTNTIVPSFCTSVAPCDSGYTPTLVERIEPNLNGLMFESAWSLGINSSEQKDYRDAFSQTNLLGFPIHSNPPPPSPGAVSVSGLGHDNDQINNTSEQYMQDGWLAVPSQLECLEFRLGQNAANEQASALWIGENYDSLKWVGESVNGNQIGGTYCIPPTVAANSQGWKLLRVRVYTHDYRQNNHDTRVMWDLGEGFQNIPPSFIQSATSHIDNTPPSSFSLAPNGDYFYALEDSSGLYWAANGTQLPSVQLDPFYPFSQIPNINPLSNCTPPSANTPLFGTDCQPTLDADPCNFPPVAYDDTLIMTAGTTVQYGDAPNNDSDPNPSDLGMLTISSVLGGSQGTASVLTNNSISYTHTGTGNQPDSIFYVICDDDVPSLCDTGTIYIFVSPDSDGDEIPDLTDADDDNDGIPDQVEDSLAALFPSDGDPVTPALDLDSDNDGIPDIVEAGGIDPNNDGMVPVGSSGLLINDPTPGDGWDESIVGTPVDSDGDGVPDYLDIDSDNDGIYDIVEEKGATSPVITSGRFSSIIDNDSVGWHSNFRFPGNDDPDSDGVPSRLDLDHDNDGICNVLELNLSDQDFDGRIDSLSDLNNDGADDQAAGEGLLSRDGGILPDHLDLDSDNDGISDLVEGGGPAPDVFGRINPIADADSDGWDDGASMRGRLDFDADQTPDHIDLDSDNDGLWDLFEAGGNSPNSIGRVSGPDNIDDGWILVTRLDGARDSDGDGVGNRTDLDSDNDGISDHGEAGFNDIALLGNFSVVLDINQDGADDTRMLQSLPDSDFDSFPDQEDLDSDNDGIADLWEVRGIDLNSDGRVDDTTGVGLDGWADNAKYSDTLDFDNDSIPDKLDLDSDQDGFFDLYEALEFVPGQISTFDPFGSGRIIPLSSSATNGWEPAISWANLPDTDQDGFPDHTDLDSDNDGLSDYFEGDSTILTNIGQLLQFNDADDNGADDNNMRLTARNSDGDIRPNHLDLDSEQDGIPDIREVVGPEDGVTGMALVTVLNDTNLDGWVDNPIVVSPDSDNDLFPNHLDLDSDNDGIADIVEGGGVDPAFQGTIQNFVDLDSNGWNDSDSLRGLLDQDGDGLFNHLDLDSDQDGLWDLLEAGGQSPSTAGQVTGTVQNGVGWAIGERVTGIQNSDNDTVPDRLDLDSDNDGISDLSESGFPDLDFNGTLDNFSDPDTNGAFDSVMLPQFSDPDADQLGNHIDLDSDGDGLPDLWEAQGPDIDSDGIVDDLSGVADDGWTDASPVFDSTNSDQSDPMPDRLDRDSDQDGFYDLYEALKFDSVQISQLDPVDQGYMFPPPMTSTKGWLQIVPKTNLPDTDQDGYPDHLDLDSDNDGLSDYFEEEETLSSNIGQLTAIIDGNGDGADDNRMRLTADDPDGDGIPNYRDLDSEQDGIPDIRESAGPENGTTGMALVNALTDLNSDGWIDVPPVVAPDFDNDTFPNQLDLDSDNDGIADLVEGGGIDTAFVGILLNITDADTNGWSDSDALLGQRDSDGDFLPDHIDLDSDGDGLWDLLEAGGQFPSNTGQTVGPVSTGSGWSVSERLAGTLNSDNDPLPDRIDLDSDNDGISDLQENNLPDPDTDGRLDFALDGNGDGAADSLMRSDFLHSDPDPLPNHRDLDSDNDGLADIWEAGGTDNNNNGKVDSAPLTGDDGWTTAHRILNRLDSDGDSLPDPTDLDADQDGLFDLFEAIQFDTPLLSLRDSNRNGRIDLVFIPLNSPSQGWFYYNDWEDIADQDNDGSRDFRDLDSDNDGLSDLFETFGVDSNEIGQMPFLPDSDGDGANDSIQSTVFDKDGDGLANHLDLDSDNDGIPDIRESQGNEQGNSGRTNSLNDANGDGWIDNPILGTADTDEDGVANHLDLDSDNDGLPDLLEESGTLPDPSTGNLSFNIGQFPNGWENTDNALGTQSLGLDSLPNYLDLDSDDDALWDRLEAGGASPVIAGRVIFFEDTTGNGWDNDERIVQAPDFDGDAVPDYMDLDSDNDGISDLRESGFSDTLLIGHLANLSDTNGDGADDSRMLIIFQNADQDTFPNQNDLDSDNDGMPDIWEAGGEDQFSDGQVDDLQGADDDGWADNHKLTGELTSDNDSIPDWLDLDSDQDGFYDAHEAITFARLDSLQLDRNLDGQLDSLGANGWVSYYGIDGVAMTDNDPFPDHLDLDSDNDGLSDWFEGTRPTGQTMNLGMEPFFRDNNGDGANDTLMRAVPANFDGDSIPDFLDLDTDQDGIPDLSENLGTSLDGNFDGRIDYGVYGNPDDHGWVIDPVADPKDRDQDGFFNHEDRDADNDGIPDVVEAYSTYPYALGYISDTLFVDFLGDRDGWDDNLGIARPLDTDRDGIRDYQDWDSDNDGISDILESDEAAVDDDNDGMIDNILVTEADGWNDSIGVTAPINTDQDLDPNNPILELPDYRDFDSDNDGVPDSVEFNYTFSDFIPPGDCNDNGIVDWRDPEICDVEFYQGFSPNGDGINDVFDVNGLEGYDGNNSIEIFNRWGDIVYSAEPWGGIWEGNCNRSNCAGSLAPDGVYFYVFRFGENGATTGYIYLVR